MQKRSLHTPPTVTLLVLAALAFGAADARAQEPKPAAPAPAEQAAKPAPAAEPSAEPSAETKAGPSAETGAVSGEATEAAARPRDERRPETAFFTAALPAAAADSPAQDPAQSSPASPPQTSSQSSSTYTPLTGEQKMKRAARNAFLNPGGYARTAFSSFWTQWNEDSQPHKTTEDEVADGATRFAINFGRRATRSLLGGGVFPVLFRQDPRYERAEEGKGAAARAGWAVSRVFVTRGDSGRHQPNVSNWAGSLSSSALSNLWERSTPGHDRIGTDATFKRFANSFVNDAINNLIREFWPDIKGIFGK